jgi:hypothetical protein
MVLTIRAVLFCADFEFPAAAAQLLAKLKVESKVKNLFG